MIHRYALLRVVLLFNLTAMTQSALAAAAIHTIAIQPIDNPAGYSWPYNLRMFQGTGAVATGGVAGAAVSGFARGLGSGDNARSAVTETILNDNNVKLGDEAVAYLRDSLSRQGFEIAAPENAAAADATLTVSFNKVGWVCDGLLMDGVCHPRIDAKTVLTVNRTGKKRFNEICHYGIESFILACSFDPPQPVTVSNLRTLLSDPANANRGLLEGLKRLSDYIALEIKDAAD
ncbi:MAG TPA: hypothetical protein VJS47_00295 [Rhizomicrobium sp.]|nr:hypothetical protein [Rhizomicrobium sp.]HKY18987.1 hypothetical protein [Rhizomicrobium sp.]